MGTLVYTAITSLDGYVNDASGGFDWAAPDEEVHAFVNDLERPVVTHLYGRRLYEVLVAWECMDVSAEPDVMRDYQQLWQAADKVVYSTTLEAVSSANTRLERVWDPQAVRRVLADSPGPVSLGGPGLAAHAFRDGLVEEVHLFLNPVLVGAGTRALPEGVRLDLELVDEHRFAGGVVHLHHTVRR
ncbi:MAG: dihydrofolate reductase family protein [Actinomycetota bacterium]|nr:dihydrofolate reductase family protein [Actinomycetota bacterium]